MSKKVWEIVPYFNEEMIFDIRRKELKSDYVVVVEGDTTFSGVHKGYNFPVSKYPNVIHMRCTLPSHMDAWQKEQFQENFPMHCFSQCERTLGDTIDNDDIVICSDCDEIPKWEAILWCKQAFEYGTAEAYRIGMTHHKYQFNLVDKTTPWECAGVCTGKVFRERNFTGIRKWDQAPVIKNAGWHLYGMSDAKKFIEKAKSTSHFNDDATIEMIKRMENGVSLRDEEKDRLEYYPIQNLPIGCLDYPQFLETE